MEWIKSLRPGDTVYLRDRWTQRNSRTLTVEKVGRRWITFTSNNLKLDLQSMRIKDSSYEVWKSVEEFKSFTTRRARWRKIASVIDDALSNSTSLDLAAHDETLSQIEQLLTSSGLMPEKPETSTHL